MRETRGTILVVRGGAIGDFVLTLPVLAALRTRFPETRLEVLGYPHIARLALVGGLADDVHSIEARPLAGFFARNGDLEANLAAYFAGFDLILSYLYDPDGIFRTNVGRCSRAQFLAGPHRPDERADLHATGVFLQPLERLAIFGADPVPRLQLKPQFPDRGNPPTLALHPGSGSETKNWPEPCWRRLIERLAGETTWHFLLVGGEAEGARLDRLATALPAGRARLARSLPLPELAAQLAPCSAFVGHDSGITHLAAAVGVPGLALWGASNAAIWRPLGERLKVMHVPGGLAHLPVDQVVDAVSDMVLAAG